MGDWDFFEAFSDVVECTECCELVQGDTLPFCSSR